MRTTLVAALAACAESKVRARARKFLSGLSADELQFIAGYLGARDPAIRRARRVPTLASRRRAVAALPDRDHKMILLAEYLRQSGGRGQSSSLPDAGVRTHVNIHPLPAAFESAPRSGTARPCGSPPRPEHCSSQ